MKSRMQKWIGVAGALCLAWSTFMRWDGISVFFFGDYPFPEE